MARFAVIFTDTPAMLETRRLREADHFDFLQRHRDRILCAGGLRPNHGGKHCGGLWIVEAEDKSEIIALIKDDPYFDPSRRSYEIMAWTIAELYGKVSL